MECSITANMPSIGVVNFTDYKPLNINTMRKFEKEFRAENPQTVGETDREFDNANYTEWLEQKVVKFITSNTVLAECSHLWTKSNTSANTDWWCSRCGKITNTIGINANLR